MFSAQTMPMAEATCASISLPVTSPMAHTPGTLVAMRSSISTMPRGLSLTPDRLQAEPLRVGLEADGHQHLLGLERLRAFRAGDLDPHAGAVASIASTFVPGQDLDRRAW